MFKKPSQMNMHWGLPLNDYQKIRIGYVLKSADVGTLFSSRYSENSSHAHTRRHPLIFTHTCAHQCTLVHNYAYPPTLCTHTHTLLHTRSSSRTHSSSCSRWVWTDQSYVIRRNTKKAEEEEDRRKRKEQESAESISGLKKGWNFLGAYFEIFFFIYVM